MDIAPRLFGILVTYRRQATLTDMLASIMNQSLTPEVLFIIDNESSDETEDLIRRFEKDWPNTKFIYIGSPENVGPAGGWAIGMKRCLEMSTNPNDWMLTLDDNDPPRTKKDVETVFQMAVRERKCDKAVGGAAVLGARFNWRTGFLTRVKDEEIHDVVDVDYIAGGKMAMYAADAIEKAGPFATELFFGGVEVEQGLRVRRAGFRIIANGDLWLARRKNSKRLDTHLEPDKVCETHWQKYYRIRNYIYMMRRFGRLDLATKWAFTQCVLKPTYTLLTKPRKSWPGFKLAVAATRDGFRGSMGRTIQPD